MPENTLERRQLSILHIALKLKYIRVKLMNAVFLFSHVIKLSKWACVEANVVPLLTELWKQL
jgi:hypothetical protein